MTTTTATITASHRSTEEGVYVQSVIERARQSRQIKSQLKNVRGMIEKWHFGIQNAPDGALGKVWDDGRSRGIVYGNARNQNRGEVTEEELDAARLLLQFGNEK